MVSEIIQTIEKISGRFSPYEVFSDWVQMMAISISNQCTVNPKVFEEREQTYISVATKYKKEEMDMIGKMTALLVIGLEEEIKDVLGEVYMQSGMGSKITGQFFTPFHISLMTARIGIDNWLNKVKNTKNDYIETNDHIEIMEPSCGGGGMIIAAARILHDEGINYQKVMRVVAQDLDWKSIYMCYVQLAFLGIDAICVQGNTLQKPFSLKDMDPAHVLFTPGRMLEAAL